jgi:holliday junction DNA helicase RuvA
VQEKGVICRLTGRVVEVRENATVLETPGGVCYEVLVPAASSADLQRLAGNEVTLFTIQYLDGNPAVGHLVPRIIGFLSETDRAFFNEFIKVKNVGMRKALRAMSVPVHHIAAGIENGDERFLATLPEVGKRTAAQILAQLRGQVQRFCAPAAVPLPIGALTAAQRVALEILVQWGDRRADAQRWIAAAVEADPTLAEPEAIVRAAYRMKHGAAR